MKHAAVLFANGFEEVEALTVVDFLRRAGIRILTAGLGSREITGAHDIHIITDITADRISPDELDGVIIPGGMPGAQNIADAADMIELIEYIYKSGKLVAAICAAPGVVLGGKTGILSGKRFTCYPGYEKYVKGGIFSEDRVVVDGTVITSRSAGTAAEFASAIIRYLEGDSAAEKVEHATLQKQ